VPRAVAEHDESVRRPHPQAESALLNLRTESLLC
jgi:hypothetical protein